MKSVWQSIKRQPIGLIALCVAVSGGGAMAAQAAWTGANIIDESLTGADVQNGSLSGADISDGSIQAADLSAGATSGGASPVFEWNPADITIDATVPAPGTVIATKDFTVPADGYYNVYSRGSMKSSGQACTSDWSTYQMDWMVDNIVGVGGYAVLDGTSVFGPQQFNFGSTAWLTAGTTHQVKVSPYFNCDNGSDPSVQISLTGLNVTVVPSY